MDCQFVVQTCHHAHTRTRKRGVCNFGAHRGSAGTDDYGAGTIDREYAAGRGRTDLTVHYMGESCIIEIKLIRHYDSPELIEEEGFEQIQLYRDRVNPAAPAYLIIFDRRPETKLKTWDERISWKYNGEVTVVGC